VGGRRPLDKIFAIFKNGETMGNDELTKAALEVARVFADDHEVSEAKRYFYYDEIEGLPHGKAVEVIVHFVSVAKLNNLPE
jgi:hypothetical protein